MSPVLEHLSSTGNAFVNIAIFTLHTHFMLYICYIFRAVTVI